MHKTFASFPSPTLLRPIDKAIMTYPPRGAIRHYAYIYA